ASGGRQRRQGVRAVRPRAGEGCEGPGHVLVEACEASLTAGCQPLSERHPDWLALGQDLRRVEVAARELVGRVRRYPEELLLRPGPYVNWRWPAYGARAVHELNKYVRLYVPA